MESQTEKGAEVETLPDEMTGQHQRSRRDVAAEIEVEMRQWMWQSLPQNGGRHARR